jgi:glucose-6-phosphate isomerase
MQTSFRIFDPSIAFDSRTGLIRGDSAVHDTRTLAELDGIFEDGPAYAALEPTTLVYSVSSVFPVEQGKDGGLFFGSTSIQPGLVGSEYFMTRGHFHSKLDTAEFYWGIGGEGVLLLMSEDRSIRAERMGPGSLHYIPGRVAHRVVNTRGEVLTFGACWPSDAGHDYESIRCEGFSARVRRGPDGPVVEEG